MTPNRILVDGHWHEIDADYRLGALTYRWDTGKAYLEKGSPSFEAGKTNESKLEHVRFGIDVVEEPSDGRDFDVDPASRHRRHGYGIRTPGYALALMRANGYLEFARRACRENRTLPPSLEKDPNWVARMRDEGKHYRLITPGVLRNRFLGTGRMVSMEFVEILTRRLAFEDKIAAAVPLGDLEASLLDRMKQPRKDLLLALGDLTFSDWMNTPRSQDVSHMVHRAPSWTAATVHKMARDGEHVFLTATRNGYAWLLPPGITAYGMLVGPARSLELGIPDTSLALADDEEDAVSAAFAPG